MNKAGEVSLTFKKWQIGDVIITRVQENETLTLPVEWLLQTTAEVVCKHAWLQPNHATPDGQLKVNLQAFIIEASGLRIMIDPCVGNDKPRSGAQFNMLKGPFLEHLTLAGFPPESIDVVLCTHLHFDHVGWNTRLVDGKWIPTFPNARHLFSRVEFEYAKAEAEAEREKADTTHESASPFNDSVMPIIDAGLAELVEFDHHIVDEVRLEPTPGHTPGHCSIHISSKGQDAVITGDLMHHPVQLCEPDVCSNFCADENIARKSRRDFLERYSDTKVVVLGTHFAEPTGILVRSEGNAWRMDGA